MLINVTFDQSQSGLPTEFVNDVDYVVNTFDALFTPNVTINIHVGFGESDGSKLDYRNRTSRRIKASIGFRHDPGFPRALPGARGASQ
jgi:hypothetical protein